MVVMDNFNVDDLVGYGLIFLYMFIFTMGPSPPLGHNVFFLAILSSGILTAFPIANAT